MSMHLRKVCNHPYLMAEDQLGAHLAQHVDALRKVVQPAVRDGRRTSLDLPCTSDDLVRASGNGLLDRILPSCSALATDFLEFRAFSS
eukprot:gene5969-5254_t